MNDTTIENLLRQAPRPAPPADLLKTLQSEITLPPVTTSRKSSTGWQIPLRRWMPALAFGLFLLSCVVILGVQSNWVNKLKQENAILRAATANLAELRAKHAQLEEFRASQAELDQLRSDNEDLQRLRAEQARLGDIPQQIQNLRSENAQLLAAAQAAGADSASDRFFKEAGERETRIACVNNLKQIGLAIRIWSNDQADRTPKSFMVMSNELVTAKILICPSDAARLQYQAVPWSQFTPEMSSYRLMTTGGEDDRFPESIVTECPIHHNYGLADGSVQSTDPTKFKKVEKDGRFYLEPVDATNSQSPP